MTVVSWVMAALVVLTVTIGILSVRRLQAD